MKINRGENQRKSRKEDADNKKKRRRMKQKGRNGKERQRKKIKNKSTDKRILCVSVFLICFGA